MKIINNHRVENLSIELVDFDKLMNGEKALIFYSDPPWNDGNLKYWNTMKKKADGINYDKVLTYEELLNIIIKIIKNHVDGYVFLEVGNNQLDLVLKKLNRILFNIKVFTCRYGSGLTNKIIFGGTNKNYTFNEDINGMKGYEIPYKCVKSVGKENKIVLDPCCGMGYSAQAAVDNNMRFYGNEFNSQRLNKTIKRL
jgi:DNA modification methylase